MDDLKELYFKYADIRVEGYDELCSVIIGFENNIALPAVFHVPETLDLQPVVGIEGDSFGTGFAMGHRRRIPTDLNDVDDEDEKEKIVMWNKWLRSSQYRGAFQGSRTLTELVLPPDLLFIRKAAFRGCTRLNRIDFPEGLEIIGEEAFSRCPALTGVFLPKSLMVLDDTVFEDCENLGFIVLPNAGILKTLNKYNGALCVAGYYRYKSRFNEASVAVYDDYVKENIEYLVTWAQNKEDVQMLSALLEFKNKNIGFHSLFDEL